MITVRAIGETTEAAAVYDDILVPSFPADQCVSRAAFMEAVSAGDFTVDVAIRSGEVVGAAVSESFASGKVGLLGWLAVGQGGRQAGIGGQLMTAWLRWCRENRYGLALAEVENPVGRMSSAAYGDPHARVRFYSRFAGKALDLPYFQPGLPPGGRVLGMMLVAFPSAVRELGSNVDGALVREFLAEYLRDEARDRAFLALASAAARDRIPLVPLNGPLDRLPSPLPGVAGDSA